MKQSPLARRLNRTLLGDGLALIRRAILEFNSLPGAASLSYGHNANSLYLLRSVYLTGNPSPMKIPTFRSPKRQVKTSSSSLPAWQDRR